MFYQVESEATYISRSGRYRTARMKKTVNAANPKDAARLALTTRRDKGAMFSGCGVHVKWDFGRGFAEFIVNPDTMQPE